MTRDKINWPYTVGLLETDGSFYIIFKEDKRMPIKYRIHPEIEWSQKNRKLLEKVQEYLGTRDIRSKVKYSPADERAGRAPRLKISGIAECKKFFVLLRTDKSASLYGNRKMDAYLMEQIFSLVEQGVHNSVEGRKKILDLKMALHVPTPDFYTLNHKFFKNLKKKLDPVQGSALSREDWERKHEIGASKGSTSKEIECAGVQYIQFARSVLEDPVKCPGEYISALVEGNGYIYTPECKKGLPRVSVSMERGGELALFMMAHYFADQSASCSKKKSSTDYFMFRRSLLSLFRSHISRFPVLFKRGATEAFLRRCTEKKID